MKAADPSFRGLQSSHFVHWDTGAPEAVEFIVRKASICQKAWIFIPTDALGLLSPESPFTNCRMSYHSSRFFRYKEYQYDNSPKGALHLVLSCALKPLPLQDSL